MIAPSEAKTQVLTERNVRLKIAHLPEAVHRLLVGDTIDIPDLPGRDVQTLPIKQLPAKKGLSYREGQARLLHDLASIELQAMELAVRTLSEFSTAEPLFRERLAQVALDEGRHLQLCLTGLEELGFPWGTYPVHIGLWQCVAREDSLLDRILIVHRYLEGSGLDASETFLKRLDGLEAKIVQEIVQVISREEVGHVQFGSEWYIAESKALKLDPEDDFSKRLESLIHRIPRRAEPIHRDLRRRVGFTEKEILALEKVRARFLDRSNNLTGL